MIYTASLSNTNYQFIVKENETILEAAIRSGVPLNYGCSGGTCGICQAKLISGEVKEIKAREFVIPEADKLQGSILTCVCTLSENSQIEANVAGSAEDIPAQKIQVKVRKVEEIARDILRIIVQTPRTKRLRFLAGQYIKINIESLGDINLAIASCPCEDRLIELHLRTSEQDQISQQIAQHMRLGDTLEIEGPFGNFVFDEHAQRPIILFAFDTGFAAIKSLLEHITAQEQDLAIHLIWMSCGEDGLYMHNLCRSWHDALDDFTYSGISLDKTMAGLMENPQAGCEIVELSMRETLGSYDDLSNYDVYVSAPAPAVELLKKICFGKNILQGRFFSEPVRGNEDLSCIVSLQKEE
ncbi:MAG: 2Fe-2S iron-sulfur cluster-binding protein [Pseudomonadota bacterium]